MGWKWLKMPSTGLNHPEPCKAHTDINIDHLVLSTFFKKKKKDVNAF